LQKGKTDTGQDPAQGCLALTNKVMQQEKQLPRGQAFLKVAPPLSLRLPSPGHCLSLPIPGVQQVFR
jgi:hypothetical protein